MSADVWPEDYWRDARWVAACFGLVLLVLFSPFLFGSASLLTSAADAPSMYLAGAAANPPSPGVLKEPDPGAAAWQSEPWLQIEHDTVFGDHRMPWWDPYDGYGAPFAADQISQPFYPLTLLASVHPSPRVWNFYLVARLFVAGFFAALFVRFYGGRSAALAAALATAFAGYYMMYLTIAHLSVETLLPALLWATEWAVRRPGLAAGGALALVAGLMHVGGMPESSATCMLGATLYVLVRVRTSAPAQRPFARLLTFGAGNVIGAAIGAIVLLPLFEYLPNAFDVHRNAVATGNYLGLGYDTMPFAQAVLQRLAPLSYGPIYNPVTGAPNGLRGWWGTAVAFCALLAVVDIFRAKGRRIAAGPAFALLVVAFCALSKDLGAVWINWIGALPVLRLIEFLKYGEPVLDVSVALLCGLGVAALERGRVLERWAPLAAGGVVLAALTWTFAAALPRTSFMLRPDLYGAVILALAALAVALAATYVRRVRPFAAAVLVAVVGIEVAADYYVPVFGKLAAIPTVARDPYRGAPYVRAVRSFRRDDERVLAMGKLLYPDWAGAMRIDSPTRLDALYPSRFFPFLNAFLTPAVEHTGDLQDRFTGDSEPSYFSAAGRRWMTLSSVGLIVTPSARVLADPHVRLLTDDGDVRIYAYADVLPRASVYHGVRVAVNDEGALAMLKEPRLDVRTTLVLSGRGSETAADVAGAAPAAGEAAHIVARDAGDVAISADLATPGYVMLNDLNFPGWTASVDGARVTVLNADYLFRAVAVPAGHHEIRFRYAPPAAALGMLLTALGLLAAAFCLAPGYRARIMARLRTVARQRGAAARA